MIPVQKRRFDKGLCISCGGERTGAGITKHRCAVCSEKHREVCRRYKARNPDKCHYPRNKEKDRARAEKQRRERLRKRVCLLCGGPFVGEFATERRCAACAEKERRYGAAYRTRERCRDRGIALPDAPDAGDFSIPMLRGAALPPTRDRKMYRIVVHVDRLILDRLHALMKHYRERQVRQGKTARTPPVSLLVRETLYEWENRPCPPPARVLLREYPLRLRLDERAFAVLSRIAERGFEGNQSAALRAVLNTALVPVIAMARVVNGGRDVQVRTLYRGSRIPVMTQRPLDDAF